MSREPYPDPTSVPWGGFEIEQRAPRNWLLRMCKLAHIIPEEIKDVLDLGPGIGRELAGALTAFPNATIHAVDYHDVLKPDIKTFSPNRLDYRTGQLYTQVLPQFPQNTFDIALLINMGWQHGFNPDNIHLLLKALKKTGLIFAMGDNDRLESKFWFTDYFTRSSHIPAHIHEKMIHEFHSIWVPNK